MVDVGFRVVVAPGWRATHLSGMGHGNLFSIAVGMCAVCAQCDVCVRFYVRCASSSGWTAGTGSPLVVRCALLGW